MEGKGERIGKERERKRVRLEMVMSMKILGRREWEVGKLFEGKEGVGEVKDLVKWVVEEMGEEKRDGVVMGGEMLDKGNGWGGGERVY